MRAIKYIILLALVSFGLTFWGRWVSGVGSTADKGQAIQPPEQLAEAENQQDQSPPERTPQPSFVDALNPSRLIASIESMLSGLTRSISSDCEELGQKVLEGTKENAAERAGYFSKHGDLKQVLLNESAIVCKGMFKGEGELPTGEYVVSEDKNGVYWKYSSKSMINQIMSLPEVQLLQQLKEDE